MSGGSIGLIHCGRCTSRATRPIRRRWSLFPFLSPQPDKITLQDHAQIWGIHCAYLRRDGQAELTWVSGLSAGLSTRTSRWTTRLRSTQTTFLWVVLPWTGIQRRCRPTWSIS